jgi:hypothetical protein
MQKNSLHKKRFSLMFPLKEEKRAGGSMKITKFTPLIMLLISLFVVGNYNTGLTKNVDDKIQYFVTDVSDSLKKTVDKIGDDRVEIQNYLDHHYWKGLVREEATSGAVTLKHLQLNDHPKAVVVKPGEKITGIVECHLDREQCSALSLYRVVLGIKGQGAQTTIGNELGIVAGKTLEQFTLVAPTEPGIYQIRFKLVVSFFEENALHAWVDDKGNEPEGTTTIGIICVKS